VSIYDSDTASALYWPQMTATGEQPRAILIAKSNTAAISSDYF